MGEEERRALLRVADSSPSGISSSPCRVTCNLFRLHFARSLAHLLSVSTGPDEVALMSTIVIALDEGSEKREGRRDPVGVLDVAEKASTQTKQDCDARPLHPFTLSAAATAIN